MNIDWEHVRQMLHSAKPSKGRYAVELAPANIPLFKFTIPDDMTLYDINGVTDFKIRGKEFDLSERMLFIILKDKDDYHST